MKTDSATSYSGASWDDGLTSLCAIIQGQIGAGKTTLAATISKHAPNPWPATKHNKKTPPKHLLKDCFWLVFDKGALLSFKERGVSVQRFDVRDYMALKNCTVMTAVEVGLREAEKAVKAGAEWVIPDTISTLDKMLDTYWQEQLLGDKEAKGPSDKSDNKLIEEVQIPKYGRMFVCHKMFHDTLMSLGVGVIYLTHSKAMMDLGLGSSDEREKQRKVRQTMQVAASGGVFVPDITGKSAAVYKSDARLQLVVRAIKGPNGKLTREVRADSIDGYETKNSWELSIIGSQEANMRKIVEKIES